MVFVPTLLFAQPSSESLSFAVVRVDGVLIPIARYEKEKMNDLYSKVDSLLFYETLQQINGLLGEEISIREWKYHSLDGDETTLVTGDLVFYDPFGEYSGFGFITNMPIKNFNNDYFPKVTVGIATNKDVIYTFFKESADSIRNEIKKILPPIKVDSALIREGLNDYNKNIKIGDSLKQYLGSLLFARTGNRTIFYYETSCQIDTSTSCPYTLDSQGKIIFEKNYVINNETTYINDCDGKSSENIKPIALITYNKKMFVVEEISYYEGIKYIVKIMN